MISQFVLTVYGSDFDFVITDQLISRGPTWSVEGGEQSQRYELQLTDDVLLGHGVDPEQFRAEVRAGNVIIQIDSVEPMGLDDGPSIFQVYLATDTGCGYFFPAVTSSHYQLSNPETAEHWYNGDVPVPGTIWFPGSYVLPNAETLHILRFHINYSSFTAFGQPASDTDPVFPQIPYADEIVAVAVQIRFPDNFDPDPQSLVAVIGATSENPTVPPGGYYEALSDPLVSSPTLQPDGSWLISIALNPDREDGWLAQLVSGFNNPPPHQTVEGAPWYYEAPFGQVWFQWTDDASGNLDEPFELVGIWFYTCLPDEEPPPPPPEPDEFVAAPPRRIYPRSDGMTMGARRVHPTSVSQQKGNRRGPGSYL